MIVTRQMKPEDASGIRSFLESNDRATIYHTLAWNKILENTYQYASQYIVCLIDDNVAGVLPLAQLRNYRGQKKIVGLPFSHFVEPLYNSAEALNALLRFAETAVKRRSAGYLEVKSDIGQRRHWLQSTAYMISELDLNRDIDQIMQGFKPSVRRNIKKARASGISVRIENRRNAFDSFYELMVETRQRQGSLPYARRFFGDLSQCLDGSQRKLYLAYSGTKPIAGLLMLVHGKRAIYAYGASTNDRGLLRLRPNELLFWKSIEDAHLSGIAVYDFGITPLDHSSLLRFKSQWGPENRKLFYSYFLGRSKSVPRLDRSGTLVSLSSSVFKMLPKPIFKMIGPTFLRLLG